MTDGQIFGLLWGPFAILFGSFFIVKRDMISRLARKQREVQGIKLTPHTQSPALMAVAGVIAICAGIAVTIAASSGALR